MPYAFVKKGYKIPAVGVVQKLLNRAGSSLTVDGDFGSHTKAAVVKFQQDRGLGSDGIVGRSTFPRLVCGERGMRVIDLVDIYDPSLANLEARDVRNAGGTAITIGGMSNGVEQAVSDVLASVTGGSVFLLRIHGHGAPGVAGISDGHGVPGEHGTSINIDNMSYAGPLLAQLRPIFSPYGCIQFMHCSTGGGQAGQALLDSVAMWTGVPTTGAVHDQSGGGLDTFAYEGSTRTSVPGFGHLKPWCESRPDFVGMSVP